MEGGQRRPDLRRVSPYGDTLGDGVVQLSFTLPAPFGPAAIEAARLLTVQAGLSDPQVAHAADLGEGMSFFVVYAKTAATVDYTQIKVARAENPVMDFYGVNEFIRSRFGRRIVVVGACTGTDAHTVGIDAIMNMKGYAGEYGLERYPEIHAVNLGSQVENAELVRKAMELRADAILVSQVVTQKDVHIPNLGELADMLEAAGLRERVVLVCGGPRIGHALALELGYDAGFGPGTRAPEVASFIVHEMARRGVV